MDCKFEGISLSSNDYNEIEKSILESYPNACILYIDKIINEKLEYKFRLYLNELRNKREEDEISIKRVFHGTKATNINSISNNGFKSSLNARSAYGKGSYFSTRANYSKDYSDNDLDDISYLFVCDIIVGKRGYLSKDKGIDIGVDNINNPTIYVCPNDNSCIPRFIVGFYKNVK